MASKNINDNPFLAGSAEPPKPITGMPSAPVRPFMPPMHADAHNGGADDGLPLAYDGTVGTGTAGGADELISTRIPINETGLPDVHLHAHANMQAFDGIHYGADNGAVVGIQNAKEAADGENKPISSSPSIPVMEPTEDDADNADMVPSEENRDVAVIAHDAGQVDDITETVVNQDGGGDVSMSALPQDASAAIPALDEDDIIRTLGGRRFDLFDDVAYPPQSPDDADPIPDDADDAVMPVLEAGNRDEDEPEPVPSDDGSGSEPSDAADAPVSECSSHAVNAINAPSPTDADDRHESDASTDVDSGMESDEPSVDAGGDAGNAGNAYNADIEPPDSTTTVPEPDGGDAERAVAVEGTAHAMPDNNDGNADADDIGAGGDGHVSVAKPDAPSKNQSSNTVAKPYESPDDAVGHDGSSGHVGRRIITGVMLALFAFGGMYASYRIGTWQRDAPVVHTITKTVMEPRPMDDARMSAFVDILERKAAAEGYDTVHIAAIAGVVYGESKGDATALERTDGSTPEGDAGCKVQPDGPSTGCGNGVIRTWVRSGAHGIGLLQWTGSRAVDYLDYADGNNAKWDDMETQVDWLLRELEDGNAWRNPIDDEGHVGVDGNAGMKAFHDAGDVATATKTMLFGFVRPAEPMRSYPMRLRAGLDAYDWMQLKSGNVPWRDGKADGQSSDDTNE